MRLKNFVGTRQISRELYIKVGKHIANHTIGTVFRVDDIYSASHLSMHFDFQAFSRPRCSSSKYTLITFGSPYLTDAHYRELITDAPSKNKYRPTLAQNLASLVEIGFCGTPRILVRITYFISKSVHTLVNRIEEFEGNIEVFLEIKTVREILLDIFSLLGFPLLGRPFEFEEIVEVRLHGDSKSSIDILRELETVLN
jgi:hypothetical protein